METRMMEAKVLGDYVVIKQIGHGSLGAVFLAEHRFMKQQYVLKLLPEELSSDRSFVQRFEEEVGMLALLDHPNIVKIHNVSFAQGQYFLVTDCVVDDLGETTNLAQYVLARDKPLDEEEIFRMLWQVADALDYAHGKKAAGKGIAHRGIKLNNILVGKGKTGTELYLSDFGLSRIIGAGAVLSRTYKAVAEGMNIGTSIFGPKGSQDRFLNSTVDPKKLISLHASFLQSYLFLSPEQKRLDSPQPVDAKADIYAFGVLAYFLLMGEFPEGIFEMPLERKSDYQFHWDGLIRSCLQSNSANRPEMLIPLLEAVRSGGTAYPMPEVLATSVAVKVVGQGVSDDETLRPIIRVAQLERPDVDEDPAAIFQIDTTVKQYTPERKEVKNISPLLTDMVVIKGGNFYRGSRDGNRDEMPRHQVTLSSYAIDIHPVTNEQYVRFLEALGGEKDSNHQDVIRMRDSRVKRSGGKLSIESGYAKHPVVGVTWYGAIAYAKWIGKRLPTEAEWEIAACGGLENTLYSTGDDIEKTQANFFSSDTTSVMSYAPNGYGLYDMSGNVYEWCHDWYGYNYYEVSVQEPENPKGPLQGVYRVLRGGCWKSLKEDLRCSRRHRNNPGSVNGTYGFRCAADVQ